MKSEAKSGPGGAQDAADAQDAGPEGDPIKRLDHTVSIVLAVGLGISVLLLMTGAVLALAGSGTSPSGLISLEDLPVALADLEPGGFLALGLLVLVATPFARVAALAVGFARIRSWAFFGISAFVLTLIALSAYLGLRG